MISKLGIIGGRGCRPSYHHPTKKGGYIIGIKGYILLVVVALISTLLLFNEGSQPRDRVNLNNVALNLAQERMQEIIGLKDFNNLAAKLEELTGDVEAYKGVSRVEATFGGFLDSPNNNLAKVEVKVIDDEAKEIKLETIIINKDR